MSKLGLQTKETNIATLEAKGSKDDFEAEYGRLNFVKASRDLKYDGWLSKSLGMGSPVSLILISLTIYMI